MFLCSVWEANYSFLDTNDNPFVNRGLGSVTGRLGYTWGLALLYVKGDYTWADSRLTNGFGGGTFSNWDGGGRDGYTVGAVWTTCSRRTGRARLGTSTMTSAPATLSSRLLLVSSPLSDSGMTSIRSRPASTTASTGVRQDLPTEQNMRGRQRRSST